MEIETEKGLKEVLLYLEKADLVHAQKALKPLYEQELGCEGRPIIPVYNKCDLVAHPDDIPHDSGSVRICAKSGEGMAELLQAIEDHLPVKLKLFRLLVPFDKASLLSEFRSVGALRSQEYTADGILAEVLLEEPLWHKAQPYTMCN